MLKKSCVSKGRGKLTHDVFRLVKSAFFKSLRRGMLILPVLVVMLGLMSFSAEADKFCCRKGNEEACCAQSGKVYCPFDETCRTRCPPCGENCCEGCITPEGVCCASCPTAEVCARFNQCQQIIDGCYRCEECAPNCPNPKCLNEEGICCDSCPRSCPEGEILTAVDGCYVCVSSGGEDTETGEESDSVGSEDTSSSDYEETGGGSGGGGGMDGILCAWGCGLDAAHPLSDVVAPNINGEPLEGPVSIETCEEALSNARCACKEGAYDLPYNNFCCLEGRGCYTRCCEEGDVCLTRQVVSGGMEYTEGTCCSQATGEGCYDENGVPMCCNKETTVCDHTAKWCCAKDEGGNYPPVLTEEDRANCLILDKDENNCWVKKDECGERDCCGGVCCPLGKECKDARYNFCCLPSDHVCYMEYPCVPGGCFEPSCCQEGWVCDEGIGCSPEYIEH